MTWFAGRWRNHQPKRAEKPHSKSARRKAPDGPATRPKTPLAVENGVGKPAAPQRARLMPVREREHGELPSPICPCLTARLGRDLLFSMGGRESSSSFVLVLKTELRLRLRGRERGRFDFPATQLGIKVGIKILARKHLFAKISEHKAKSTNQIKLWDASTTTSSKPSAARRWSN